MQNVNGYCADIYSKIARCDSAPVWTFVKGNDITDRKVIWCERQKIQGKVAIPLKTIGAFKSSFKNYKTIMVSCGNISNYRWLVFKSKVQLLFIPSFKKNLNICLQLCAYVYKMGYNFVLKCKLFSTPIFNQNVATRTNLCPCLNNISSKNIRQSPWHGDT